MKDDMTVLAGLYHLNAHRYPNKPMEDVLDRAIWEYTLSITAYYTSCLALLSGILGTLLPEVVFIVPVILISIYYLRDSYTVKAKSAIKSDTSKLVYNHNLWIAYEIICILILFVSAFMAKQALSN
jgi:hypothetical protein